MTLRCTLLAVLFAAFFAVPALGSDAAFRADCAELAKAPNRLTGTAGGAAAAAYVEKRLREIGADQVIVQPFATVQTRRQRWTACSTRSGRGTRRCGRAR